MEPLRGWLGEWADAIGYHHEHWDGTGYPRGTAGEAIPLGGRIVAIADVFDVITSTRSYKESATPAEARAELVRWQERNSILGSCVRSSTSRSDGCGSSSGRCRGCRMRRSSSACRSPRRSGRRSAASLRSRRRRRQVPRLPGSRRSSRVHSAPAIARVSQPAASTVAFVPHDPAFRVIRHARVLHAPAHRRPGPTGATVAGAQAPTAAPTPTRLRRRRRRRRRRLRRGPHPRRRPDDHGHASDDDRTPGAAHDDRPTAGAGPADDHHPPPPRRRRRGQRRAELHGGCQPSRARGLRRAYGRRLGDRNLARACVRELADGDVHVSSDNAGLFSAAPAVAPNGTLDIHLGA